MSASVKAVRQKGAGHCPAAFCLTADMLPAFLFDLVFQPYGHRYGLVL